MLTSTTVIIEYISWLINVTDSLLFFYIMSFFLHCLIQGPYSSFFFSALMVIS